MHINWFTSLYYFLFIIISLELFKMVYSILCIRLLKTVWCVFIEWIEVFECLMPFSSIFRLYRGIQFKWWRKSEYPLKPKGQRVASSQWETLSHKLYQVLSIYWHWVGVWNTKHLRWVLGRHLTSVVTDFCSETNKRIHSLTDTLTFS